MADNSGTTASSSGGINESNKELLLVSSNLAYKTSTNANENLNNVLTSSANLNEISNAKKLESSEATKLSGLEHDEPGQVLLDSGFGQGNAEKINKNTFNNAGHQMGYFAGYHVNPSIQAVDGQYSNHASSLNASSDGEGNRTHIESL